MLTYDDVSWIFRIWSIVKEGSNLGLRPFFSTFKKCGYFIKLSKFFFKICFIIREVHFEFLPSTKVQHLWVQAPPKEVFSFWNLILNRLFYVFQYIWNNLWYSWNYLYILATSVRQILQKVLWSWKVKIQNARLLWWTHLVTLWSFSSDTNSFVLHFLVTPEFSHKISPKILRKVRILFQDLFHYIM